MISLRIKRKNEQKWNGKCFVWSRRETKIGCLLSATTHWTYTKSLVRWMRYFIIWYSSYITWQTCVDGYFLAINKTQFKTHAIWITFFTLNITVVYKTRMCQCVTSLFQCVSMCYWLWWRKQHRCVCVLLPPSDTTSQKHLCSLSIIILQHLLPCVFFPILYSFLLVQPVPTVFDKLQLLSVVTIYCLKSFTSFLFAL